MTQSVWGKGDKETLEILEKEHLHGKWLNLAAGDGRYNTELLKKVDFVVASDIDKDALKFLVKNTPKELASKLQIKRVDINRQFPFSNGEFDGVFCTGFLHLLAIENIEKVIGEIERVLNGHGKLILDFATNIKRVLPDGTYRFYKNERGYSTEEGLTIFNKLLGQYSSRIIKSTIKNEKVNLGDVQYLFNCDFFVLIIDKSKT